MLLTGASIFACLAFPAPSILVTDGLAKSALTLLESSGATVVEKHCSLPELIERLPAFDAVIIRSATSLEASAIDAGSAGRLRVLGRAGVGVDNIDLDAARANHCWVLNTPGASTQSVVELTLAHMLAAARGLQDADQGLKTGSWLKGQLRLGAQGGPRVGHELAGKALGILGFGRIAQSLATTASALGMSVHAFSPNADPQRADALGVTLVPTEADLFAKCTHVVVMCALNERTRGLVCRRRIALMPQRGMDGTYCGSHLFNMARGGIVVEADVAKALQAGSLNTYATDVFEQEPPPTDHPLLISPNFHGTPHVGAATLEAQARVGIQIATNVLAALEYSHDSTSLLPEGIVCQGRISPKAKPL